LSNSSKPWLSAVSFSQFFRHDARLEPVGERRLEHQRRDQRDQVGIAATLADAVERALDLPHAGLDGGQRIGDRLPVSLWAWMPSRSPGIPASTRTPMISIS
jgi:hypothetical protein